MAMTRLSLSTGATFQFEEGADPMAGPFCFFESFDFLIQQKKSPAIMENHSTCSLEYKGEKESPLKLKMETVLRIESRFASNCSGVAH
jgi:hypothetical protein